MTIALTAALAPRATGLLAILACLIHSAAPAHKSLHQAMPDAFTVACVNHCFILMLMAQGVLRFNAVLLHQAMPNSTLAFVNLYLVHVLVAQDAQQFYAEQDAQ